MCNARCRPQSGLKKVLWIVGLAFSALFVCNTVGLAFLYEVEVLDEKAIGKLSDQKLLDTYVDVVVELEASKTFAESAGIQAKDYRKYKDLVRYRINLLMEMKQRELEVPQIEQK